MRLRARDDARDVRIFVARAAGAGRGLLGSDFLPFQILLRAPLRLCALALTLQLCRS